MKRPEDEGLGGASFSDDSLAARGSNEAAPGLPTREQIARIIDPHAADYNFEAAVHDLYEYDLAEAVWKKADAVLALMPPPQRDRYPEITPAAREAWNAVHRYTDTDALRAKIEALRVHATESEHYSNDFAMGMMQAYERTLALLDARDGAAE